METPETLLERAERFREMAVKERDPHLSAMLKSIAEGFERRSHELSERPEPSAWV